MDAWDGTMPHDWIDMWHRGEISEEELNRRLGYDGRPIDGLLVPEMPSPTAKAE